MTLRLGLGFDGWSPASPPIVLHVGGDFWYSRRLARRWRAPAFAFVERAHVARVHRAFERIFVPSDDLRARLIGYSVPSHKILVTGDPRHDAIARRQAESAEVPAEPGQSKVTFLAGSRDGVFRAVFPFWVQTAAALLAQQRQTLTAARIEVVQGTAPYVAGSDLVLTIPGTNTMELAIMRIPTLVVLPFNLAPQIPAEGLIEWITRVPYVGPALRLFLAREYVKRRPYVALPNMRAGRRIMPELTGLITAEQVAAESARIVSDQVLRGSLVTALEAIPVEPGASGRILSAMGLAWSAA
jgi:hypothetical protein